MNKVFVLKDFAKGEKESERVESGNALIYTRVSSSEQVDGQSLEVQLEKCREYAVKHSPTPFLVSLAVAMNLPRVIRNGKSLTECLLLFGKVRLRLM